MLKGMNREKIKNLVAKALGLEHAGTIWFFELCEQYDDNLYNNGKLLEIATTLLILAQDISELE